jgi:hypothetical protein
MIPADAVSDLVPFAHVTDVDRSVAFMSASAPRRFTRRPPRLAGCGRSSSAGDARLMVAAGDGAFDADAQGIIFYLYTRDLDALRARLVAGGVDAGEITTGGPGPDRQLEVTDPDGYVLVLAEIEGERVGVLQG